VDFLRNRVVNKTCGLNAKALRRGYSK